MPVTYTTERYRKPMIIPKSWQPLPPKVRFLERGKFLYTKLSLNVAPGVTMNFSSRVDLELIEKNLRDGVVDDVSGIFGSIFKGIKKAVKAVGKATGLNKVVKGAKMVIDNPIIQAVVPGAAVASAGMRVASDISSAQGIMKGIAGGALGLGGLGGAAAKLGAKALSKGGKRRRRKSKRIRRARRGRGFGERGMRQLRSHITKRKKLANYYLTRAAVTAEKAGFDKSTRAAHAKAGAKMYQLIVQPK